MNVNDAVDATLQPLEKKAKRPDTAAFDASTAIAAAVVADASPITTMTTTTTTTVSPSDDSVQQGVITNKHLAALISKHRIPRRGARRAGVGTGGAQLPTFRATLGKNPNVQLIFNRSRSRYIRFSGAMPVMLYNSEKAEVEFVDPDNTVGKKVTPCKFDKLRQFLEPCQLPQRVFITSSVEVTDENRDMIDRLTKAAMTFRTNQKKCNAAISITPPIKAITMETKIADNDDDTINEDPVSCDDAEGDAEGDVENDPVEEEEVEVEEQDAVEQEEVDEEEVGKDVAETEEADDNCDDVVNVDDTETSNNTDTDDNNHKRRTIKVHTSILNAAAQTVEVIKSSSSSLSSNTSKIQPIVPQNIIDTVQKVAKASKKLTKLEQKALDQQKLKNERKLAKAKATEFDVKTLKTQSLRNLGRAIYADSPTGNSTFLYTYRGHTLERAAAIILEFPDDNGPRIFTCTTNAYRVVRHTSTGKGWSAIGMLDHSKILKNGNEVHVNLKNALAVRLVNDPSITLEQRDAWCRMSRNEYTRSAFVTVLSEERAKIDYAYSRGPDKPLSATRRRKVVRKTLKFEIGDVTTVNKREGVARHMAHAVTVNDAVAANVVKQERGHTMKGMTATGNSKRRLHELSVLDADTSVSTDTITDNKYKLRKLSNYDDEQSPPEALGVKKEKNRQTGPRRTTIMDLEANITLYGTVVEKIIHRILLPTHTWIPTTLNLLHELVRKTIHHAHAVAILTSTTMPPSINGEEFVLSSAAELDICIAQLWNSIKSRWAKDYIVGSVIILLGKHIDKLRHPAGPIHNLALLAVDIMQQLEFQGSQLEHRRGYNRRHTVAKKELAEAPTQTPPPRLAPP